MASKIKVAVIGVGVMGANHARVYSEMPEVELVGVFDEDSKRARAIADLNKCRMFSGLEECLQSGVEAVTVAVPSSLHKEIVVQSLRRGIHTLVEKPIAGTLEDADCILETARTSGAKLMVGHIERFNPVVQALKAMFKKGDIISINIVRVGPLPPRIKDVGVIIDLGVHDIDLVRYLTQDDIEDVYCVKSSNVVKFEDTASLMLRMKGGGSAQITTNWITPFKAREIQVIAKDKFVRGNLLTQHVQEFGRFSAEDQSYMVRDVYVKQEEPLRKELEAFANSIRNNLIPPITGLDGYEALKTAVHATLKK